jgi:hypothetical protein
MDSLEHVDQSRIKKFQIWNVHKLAIIKFNQITILDRIWFQKMILGWNHLQWLQITVIYPVVS